MRLNARMLSANGISFEYRHGIHLPDLSLWLDPHYAKPMAVVSHAHSDHAVRHRTVYATPATLALMGVRGIAPEYPHPLPFGAKLQLQSALVELIPAGHVLGSAQTRIEHAHGSLLYTGDFKVRPGFSCESAAVRHADVLIMETTYGLRRYQFPDASVIASKIKRFCLDALADGAVPVLFGYSLGKAQEVLRALDGCNVQIAVHEAIARITRVYESFGYTFPPWQQFVGQNLSNTVLIVPPSARGSSQFARLQNVRTAMITGWALDPAARYRFRCDEVFALSDHADYAELMQFVEAVNPRIVYTLHGYAESFATDLRARGIEAWSLISHNQLEFQFEA